jgi:hypothetical protein
MDPEGAMAHRAELVGRVHQRLLKTSTANGSHRNAKTLIQAVEASNNFAQSIELIMRINAVTTITIKKATRSWWRAAIPNRFSVPGVQTRVDQRKFSSCEIGH